MPGPFISTTKQEADSKVAADLGWRKNPSSVGRVMVSLLTGIFWFMTFRSSILVHSDVFLPCWFIVFLLFFFLTCPGHVSFLQLFGKRYNMIFPKNFNP